MTQTLKIVVRAEPDVDVESRDVLELVHDAVEQKLSHDGGRMTGEPIYQGTEHDSATGLPAAPGLVFHLWHVEVAS